MNTMQPIPLEQRRVHSYQKLIEATTNYMAAITAMQADLRHELKQQGLPEAVVNETINGALSNATYLFLLTQGAEQTRTNPTIDC